MFTDCKGIISLFSPAVTASIWYSRTFFLSLFFFSRSLNTFPPWNLWTAHALMTTPLHIIFRFHVSVLLSEGKMPAQMQTIAHPYFFSLILCVLSFYRLLSLSSPPSQLLLLLRERFTSVGTWFSCNWCPGAKVFYWCDAAFVFSPSPSASCMIRVCVKGSYQTVHCFNTHRQAQHWSRLSC